MGKTSRADSWVRRFRNHRLGAVIVVVASAIIALAAFTDAVSKLSAVVTNDDSAFIVLAQFSLDETASFYRSVQRPRSPIEATLILQPSSDAALFSIEATPSLPSHFEPSNERKPKTLSFSIRTRRDLDVAYREIRQRFRTAWAQRALYLLGLYSGPADGEWTDRTANALLTFQRAHHLSISGVLDDASWKMLEPLSEQPDLDYSPEEFDSTARAQPDIRWSVLYALLEMAQNQREPSNALPVSISTTIDELRLNFGDVAETLSYFRGNPEMTSRITTKFHPVYNATFLNVGKGVAVLSHVEVAVVKGELLPMGSGDEDVYAETIEVLERYEISIDDFLREQRDTRQFVNYSITPPIRIPPNATARVQIQFSTAVPGDYEVRLSFKFANGNSVTSEIVSFRRNGLVQ